LSSAPGETDSAPIQNGSEAANGKFSSTTYILAGVCAAVALLVLITGFIFMRQRKRIKQIPRRKLAVAKCDESDFPQDPSPEDVGKGAAPKAPRGSRQTPFNSRTKLGPISESPSAEDDYSDAAESAEFGYEVPLKNEFQGAAIGSLLNLPSGINEGLASNRKSVDAGDILDELAQISTISVDEQNVTQNNGLVPENGDALKLAEQSTLSRPKTTHHLMHDETSDSGALKPAVVGRSSVPLNPVKTRDVPLGKFFSRSENVETRKPRRASPSPSDSSRDDSLYLDSPSAESAVRKHATSPCIDSLLASVVHENDEPKSSSVDEDEPGRIPIQRRPGAPPTTISLSQPLEESSNARPAETVRGTSPDQVVRNQRKSNSTSSATTKMLPSAHQVNSPETASFTPIGDPIANDDTATESHPMPVDSLESNGITQHNDQPCTESSQSEKSAIPSKKPLYAGGSVRPRLSRRARQRQEEGSSIRSRLEVEDLSDRRSQLIGSSLPPRSSAVNSQAQARPFEKSYVTPHRVLDSHDGKSGKSHSYGGEGSRRAKSYQNDEAKAHPLPIQPVGQGHSSTAPKKVAKGTVSFAQPSDSEDDSDAAVVTPVPLAEPPSREPQKVGPATSSLDGSASNKNSIEATGGRMWNSKSARVGSIS
jgi:hypothetical protein